MMNPSTKDLPGSGTIKLSEIKAEFGKGNNLLSYLGAGGVTSSAPLKLTDFYGASDSAISFPATSATYSEWSNTGVPNEEGSASGLNGSWTWSTYSALNTRTEASQAGPKTLPNNTTFLVEYDATMTTPQAGAILYLGSAFFASTPLSGHNKKRTDIKMLESILGSTVSGKFFNVNGNSIPFDAFNPVGTFRKQGQFEFTTNGNGPHQIGLMMRCFSDVAYGPSNASVTVHSFKMTSLGRRSVREILGDLKSNKAGTMETPE